MNPRQIKLEIHKLKASYITDHVMTSLDDYFAGGLPADFSIAEITERVMDAVTLAMSELDH